METGTLIGMGSILLDGCRIGRHCLVAAGAVVPPDTTIPDGQVVMGIPGRVVRPTDDGDRAYHYDVIRSYVDLGRRHAAGEYPKWVGE